MLLEQDSIRHDLGPVHCTAKEWHEVCAMAPNWRVAVAHEPPNSGDATAAGTCPAVDYMDLSLLDFSGDFWLDAPFDI